MLIYLNKAEYPTTQEELVGWLTDPDCLRLWERLAEVLGDGRHAVWAPPRLLMWAAELEGLSAKQRAALRRAHTEVTQKTVDLCGVSCALVLNGPKGLRPQGDLKLLQPKSPSKEAPPAGEMRRDWRWFAKLSESFAKATLFAENRFDAELMLWIARALAARMKPAHANAEQELSIVCRGGGGDTTGPELSAHIQHGHPTLCVLDADKAHKGADEGGTAKKARKELSKLSDLHLRHPHWLLALDAYTIENIVPVDLVRAACQSAGWVEVMARRGFFVQRTADASLGAGVACVDPALKYIRPDLKPAEASAERLLASAKSDQVLTSYREEAIKRIRELDPSAPTNDHQPLVVSIGKLPESLVATLETFRDYKQRPGNHPSAAHWLCAQLLATPERFVEEWEHVARAVWSWGLRFPPQVPP